MSGPGALVTPPPAAPRRVETERMVLSAPGPGDREEIAGLLGDPSVGRWLGGTLDPVAALGALDRWSGHWAAHGFGLWIARDRAHGRLVGRGGLSMTVVDGRAEVEVGWAIVRERWGQGLATELGAAALAVADGPLAVRGVVSFTLRDNVRSRRVMEKLGLRPELEVVHRGLPHILYRRPAAGA